MRELLDGLEFRDERLAKIMDSSKAEHGLNVSGGGESGHSRSSRPCSCPACGHEHSARQEAADASV
jgi:hypothetical protein